SGPVIERGTLVIQNGRIAAVGASVTVPAGAQIIDASGKVVTPGLLDSSTGLGTVEIGAAAGTNDQASRSDRITAAFNPLYNLNPFSTLIPVTRVEGITRAVVAPSNGASFLAGQGLLVDLGNLDANIMIHRNPTAMYAELGEAGAESTGGTRATNILRLREVLQDARDYQANRAAFEAGNRRDYSLSRLDLEALGPVVRGEVPVAIQVNRASDILNALRLAKELNLRIILHGAAEGWMVAREIAQANVPVVINPLTNLPSFDAPGITFENAARLHNAGAAIALASFDSHNARNLKQIAGNAVAYGLPHDAALRAVTLTPARIWGIADRYGSLEVGKDADVVVWSGDPFELTTTVERVFIRGVSMPMQTRQIDLIRRYRQITGPMPPAYRN
ncbi:MAG TPA: amidohydrolase family protein, partial [Longimicrobiales bacterium]|nr:amidohydrolase family protein [Longimicrobiales bacterium]